MENPTINLKHYVAVMTHLCFRSSLFAKECAENPNLGKYEKAADDPVTDVQIKSYRRITRFRLTWSRELNISFPSWELWGRRRLTTKGRLTTILTKLIFKTTLKSVNLMKMCQLMNFAFGLTPLTTPKDLWGANWKEWLFWWVWSGKIVLI